MKHKYKAKARLDIAIQALEKIKEMGYNSQAARATDTVLACIRVAEAALLEVGGKRMQTDIGPLTLEELRLCKLAVVAMIDALEARESRLATIQNQIEQYQRLYQRLKNLGAW